MKEIIVYTTNCPLCLALEKLLDEQGIQYSKNTDVNEMLSRGFSHVPMVEIRDNEEVKILDYKEAKKYFGGK